MCLQVGESYGASIMEGSCCASLPLQPFTDHSQTIHRPMVILSARTGAYEHPARAAERRAARAEAADFDGQPLIDGTVLLPWSFAGRASENAFHMGAPPRPRAASPSSPTEWRQVKTQRVDDGMEQSLVVYEAPTQPPEQSTAPMRRISGILQTMAASSASSATAAAADEGVDQPMAIAASPVSSEGESGAAAPASQIQQALADIRASRQAEVAAHKQFMTSSKQAEQDLLVLLSAHAAATAQPMQPPKQSPPKQVPAQRKPLKQQPTKQHSQQPKQHSQPGKQPLFAEVLAAGCGAMVTAMLPPSMQTQPQWQPQAHQRKAQRPQQQQHHHHQPKQTHQSQKQHQQQRQRQASVTVGVDRFSHLLHFTLSGKGLATEGSAAEVVRRAVAQVEGGAGVVVVDSVRLGSAASPRFQFKVASLEQADVLVRGRGKAFAGAGVMLSEVLSAREAALHKQLYPDFLRLKAAGRRVQFRRARLFVDGQLWSVAQSPAAA